MRQFNVTGMSCAACSARVEKAVRQVPGVESCAVSLLTNSMGVEGTAPDSAVIAAVDVAVPCARNYCFCVFTQSSAFCNGNLFYYSLRNSHCIYGVCRLVGGKNNNVFHPVRNREGYVSLAQLAEEHEISVSHLQKLFKQVYGMPVYHYIKEYRLEQAAVELARSKKPITQIAQNAGYDNASKFSEAFRKRYGATPSQYRANANRLAKWSTETRTE